ncbi:hypothetical protein ID866_4530 [Astraeus odoratus]|nr:hypothetical protein ID866_4530 [Astraeus odoratus]
MFTPKVIYDGNAIAYSSRDLAIGQSHSVRILRLFVTQTASILNPPANSFRELRKFISGQTQQQTPKVIMAINLLQLIVRQASNLQHPNNVKAFFSKRAGFRSLGGGLEVWKGFYQYAVDLLCFITADPKPGVYDLHETKFLSMWT